MIILSLPVLAFMLIHLVLERYGYDPVPWLPLMALFSCFFYGYYVTVWLRDRD